MVRNSSAIPYLYIITMYTIMLLRERNECMKVDINEVRSFIKEEKPKKELIDKMKKVIEYCSNLYYDSDKETPLSDKDWDSLVNHYNHVSEKVNTVNVTKLKSSKNKNIANTAHLFPELVGTLAKTNYISIADKMNADNPDADTVEEWFNRLEQVLDPYEDYSFYISWKLDGNSVTLTYNDEGKLELALTRGKNGLGADKTKYFNYVTLPNCVKKLLKKGDKVCIKCEAITTFNDKVKIEEKLGKSYASPCSLVAGLLTTNEISQDVIRMISLAPIRIQFMKNKLNRLEELKLISKMHDETRNFKICINPILNKGKLDPILKMSVDVKTGRIKINDKIKNKNKNILIDCVAEVYQNFIKKRDNLPYPVDGLVFEFVDEKLREELGRTKNENNFEFALKFPYETKLSKVKYIEFYESMKGTGIITPVVHFEKVKFDRAECEYVSISNYDRFKKMNLAEGDEIVVEYRNDVLAYIYETDKRSGKKPFKFITKCPTCGKPLKLSKTKVFVRCTNKKCDNVKIGRYNNYLTEIGILGVKFNILKDLYNAGLLKGLSYLYRLKVSDIISIKGYKEKLAQNIIDAIHEKTEFFDYEILGALGIEGIKSETAKIVSKAYTIDEMYEIMDDDFDDLELHLVDLRGISNITAKNFISGLRKNKKTIAALKKYILIKDYKNFIKKTDHPERIVFTGFRDSKLKEKLELAGHTVTGSVSGKTTMLVSGNQNGETKKEKDAKSLGIPIYTVEEFHNEILERLV